MNIEEFDRFHELLVSGAPNGYEPEYIILEEGSKRPVDGVSWNDMSYSHRDVRKWAKKGGNVGLAAREYDYLAVMDIDDMSVAATIKTPTLLTKSKSRKGVHAFYFGDGMNTRHEDYGEVDYENSYVVCPGSYVEPDPEHDDMDDPDVGHYTLVNEVEPAWIATHEYPDWVHESIRDSMDLGGDGSGPPEDWELDDRTTSMIFSDIIYCSNHADEWTDGRKRTLEWFIIPRLRMIGFEDETIRELADRWLQGAGKSLEGKYLDAFNNQSSFEFKMHPESIMRASWGPNNWFNEGTFDE